MKWMLDIEGDDDITLLFLLFRVKFERFPISFSEGIFSEDF